MSGYLEDGMDDWPHKSGRRRRPPRDGIRLRSQRGQVGETWWSRRFLDPLEGEGTAEAGNPNDPFDHFLYRSHQRRTDSRVTRGKSYARSGQVSSLRVSPGKVTALVQGSRRKPYVATVFLPALSPEQWEQVTEALAAKALYSASLLAGEMPREIEQLFSGAGATLFPASLDALQFGCSCPDDARPCKHAAAVLYVLAERFDEDPFLILEWRGQDKNTLLEKLRLRRSAFAGTTAEGEADVEEASLPVRDPLSDFWTGGDLSGLKLQARAAANPEAVLGQLDKSMFQLEGQPLVDALAPVYTAAAQRAEEVALQQPAVEADE